MIEKAADSLLRRCEFQNPHGSVYCTLRPLIFHPHLPTPPETSNATRPIRCFIPHPYPVHRVTLCFMCTFVCYVLLTFSSS